jgi:predicted RNA binding protein YcfA (HicA-like mRNA interferase family)
MGSLQLRPDRLVRALQGAGFTIERQTGSHVILKGKEGHFANVPMHAGRDVPSGTLRAILTDAGMTVDQLRNLL